MQPPLPRARLLLVLLLVPALQDCSAPQAGRSHAVAARPAPAARDPLEAIARCEDRRTDGDGLLQALAERGEMRTRLRAIAALGRLPLEGPAVARRLDPVSDALVKALEATDPAVRAAAAFALGQRADPATVDALLASTRDPDAPVRARVIEALSKIPDPRTRRAVLTAFDDDAGEVRGSALFGSARFPADAADGGLADAALCAFLQRDDAPGRPAADADTRWRALFALARRKAAQGRAQFLRFAGSDDERERIFAVQGLGFVPADAETLAALRARLADPGWRVASEAAMALGRLADAGSCAALSVAAARARPEHAAHHVRRAAIEALGALGPAAALVQAAVVRALDDESAAVRAAAVVTLARIDPSDREQRVARAAGAEDAVVRAGAAAAGEHLVTATALPILVTLVRDPLPRVATTAAEALAPHAADPAARALLRELLASTDNGLRLAAVTALKARVDAEDLPALELCLRTSQGEIGSEVAAGIVDRAVELGGDRGLALLLRASSHADPHVSRKARAAALRLRPGVELPPAPAPAARGETLPVLAWEVNPRVSFETTRGTLVFELLGDEAPFHVTNLLELARAGHYDGLTFHRVVPDFVVQGGDHRGDGNGGLSWRGDNLRAEFGPRPFTRGALGMPRNDDPDSAGSQVFVTHRDTPHLDGRYTLFGELREGFDVLDAVEVGDRIVAARVVDPGRPRR